MSSRRRGGPDDTPRGCVVRELVSGDLWGMASRSAALSGASAGRISRSSWMIEARQPLEARKARSLTIVIEPGRLRPRRFLLIRCAQSGAPLRAFDTQAGQTALTQLWRRYGVLILLCGMITLLMAQCSTEILRCSARAAWGGALKTCCCSERPRSPAVSTVPRGNSENGKRIVRKSFRARTAERESHGQQPVALRRMPRCSAEMRQVSLCLRRWAQAAPLFVELTFDLGLRLKFPKWDGISGRISFPADSAS